MCISESSVRPYRRIHVESRRKAGLVPEIPKDGDVVCPECALHCRPLEEQLGYCHNREVRNGKIVERFGSKAPVTWYFDPLPTNCVADWVCPIMKERDGGIRQGRWNNLAVFYGSCNSDCLFCQNASYREMMRNGGPLMNPRELASVANERTACVCYFGGDPSCNARHSLETSELLFKERNAVVCYETNGKISHKWLNRIANIVMESGGTIKFDLKARSEEVYEALTGTSNHAVFTNFRRLAERGKQREGEFLIASILLIPGYIGLDEIRSICTFIADCDPSIPTSLLGFSPRHFISDLPRTSRRHASEASRVAKECGLLNVRVGNVHLLSTSDYII